MTTKRSRLAALGLLLGALAVGALVGGVGVTMAEHRGVGPGKHRGGRDGYVERLTAELHLSRVQQDSIRAAVERHEPGFDSLWREIRPRFDSLRHGLRAEIRAQLTAEQQQRYAEMLERRDRKYGRRNDDKK